MDSDSRAQTVADTPHVGANLDLTQTPLPLAAGDRYQARDVLGRGGMGEVRLALDRTIGREIAIKVIRQPVDGDLRHRFLREARVQGQLEHPSIVPVHELGTGADGALYFTMKRVRGESLAEILDGMREGKSVPRRRLLSAFSTVCLAVDFAHSRGVLHRDLKPGNLMLGDFGEVYVLDWGLARLTGAPMAESLDASAPLPAETHTARGSVLGTPGYMSPEQLKGELATLDGRADVYALGCILFELLTLEALHRGDTVEKLIQSTFSDPRLAERAAQLPPELVAICVRATDKDRAARFPTARALSRAIDAFLDGEHDLERRRALAARHAEAAEAALKDEERAVAMREVTSALGLDPGNAAAVRALVHLLTEPPRELPPEAVAEMQATHRLTQQTGARTGILAYGILMFFVPLIFWMGVRNWALFCVMTGCFSLAAVVAVISFLRPNPEGRAPLPNVIMSYIALASASFVFGPLVLVPVLVLANTLGFIASTHRSRRLIVMICGSLAIAVPFVLAELGLLPQPYLFTNGAMTIQPVALLLPRVASLVYLLASNVGTLIMMGLFIARYRDSQLEAERRLYLNSWQLRQIIPDTNRVIKV